MVFKTRKFIVYFILIISAAQIITPVHPVLAAEKPVTIVTYLTWYPAFATLNGCNSWASDGFGHKSSAKKGGVRNYPYPPRNQQEKHPLENFNPKTPREAFADASILSKIQSMLDQEMDDIKKAGFDMIAIDILPIPPEATNLVKEFCGINAVKHLGERAKLKGIRSVILSDVMNRSGDYPNGRVMTATEWEHIYQDMIQHAQNWDWYWKKGGKYPVILQFAAGEGSIMEGGTRLNGMQAIRRWYEIKERLDAKNIKGMYFLDFRSNTIPALIANNDDNIGGFVFAPGAPQGLVNLLTSKIKNSAHDTIWTVSPGYYNQNHKAFFAPDFSRIHKAYMEAINNNINKILFITWNDFREDTDMAPSLNKGDALVNLLAYYNEWFKTKNQPVREKSILVFALPLRKPKIIISHPPAWAQGNGKDYNEDQTHQKVYFWIYTPYRSKTNLYFNGSAVEKPTLATCTDHRGCITIDSFDLDGYTSGEIVLERINEKGEKFVSEKKGGSVTSVHEELQRTGAGGLEYRYHALEK